MRFVQFLRRKDSIKRLGVLSEDYRSVLEIPDTCSDMISFIAQNPNLEEIEDKLRGRNYETLSKYHTLLAPVTNPEKIICIGLNYSDHCLEQNKPKPKEPMFFSKYASTLIGHKENVIAHAITNKLDWEVELAVILGKKAYCVTRESAMEYVFGYSIAQDISARDWQKERNGGQFLIGKSMDTFCPLGPAIVHKTLIRDPNNLVLKSFVNGIEKQNANTEQMIFKIDTIISDLSQAITLKPGDIILTGTPKGVGMHRNPPEYLKPGDIIESEIDGLGKLVNRVVAPSS